MSLVVGTAALAVVTALACCLPGVFVVLRRSSMLVDAIGHAVLPGIVVGYLLTRDLDSPVLIIGAALAGLVVVLGAQWLSRTGLLTGDSPQALVFPVLFSIGVILVSTRLANVHLDTHAVLVGDLNLAAWDQLRVAGADLGPSYLAVMLGVLVVNALALWLLHPRLTAATIDHEHASCLGLRPTAVGTLFMFLLSLTVTAAFNAAGAILVAALVVVPPATGYLLSTTLRAMVALTAIIAALGALAGFAVAYVLDAATSAGMAVLYGLMFLLVLTVRNMRRRRRRGAAPSCSGASEARGRDGAGRSVGG